MEPVNGVAVLVFDNGDGCEDVMTRCLALLMAAHFSCAGLPHRMKTAPLPARRFTAETTASVNLAQPVR